MQEWFTQNWSSLVETAGIVASLLFTAFTIREDTRSRRVSNLIAITQSHREMWKLYLERPELTRVFDRAADTGIIPVTREEEVFVNLILVHLGSVYQTLKAELLISLDGLRADVRAFFKLPVPGAVWKKTKKLQNEDFAAFVDECLK